MTLPDWQLVCSGPSASRWPISPRAKVATVNGAIGLLEDREPDAYGVFEANAGKSYRPIIKKARRSATQLYLKPASLCMSGQIEHRKSINMIDRHWGPKELLYLHRDVQWKAEDPAVPEFGQSVAWITSGVLMAWVLAEVYQPERIYLSGLDLYPEDSKDEDYATGITKVFDLDTQSDWRERRRQLNKRALEGLRAVTNHYRGTDFIWLEEPNFPLSDIGARIADPEDLRRLYIGAEQ